MTNFIENYTLFVTLGLTGVVVWIIGLIVQNKQPTKINHIYGYRTKRSMKSQEAWDFAQEYSIRLMIQAAQFMCILSGFSLFLELESSSGATIGTVLVIVILFYPIILTERALKDRFDPK
jgi:uncharacterized membrane protein